MYNKTIFMMESFIGLVLVTFLIGMGFLLEKPLVIFFHFEKSFRLKIIGSFFAFSLLSFFSGLSVIFYQINYLSSFLIFGLTLLSGFGLNLWATRNEFPETVVKFEPKQRHKISLFQTFLLFTFAGLVIYGFYLLISSKTGESVVTPWQNISPLFIYVFALASLLISILIYSGLSPVILLWLLVSLSFLQHSYLPLSSELFYGADGWRHVAVEEQLLNGNPIPEPEISDESSATRISSFIGKIAYSQLWGVSVLITKLTQVDIIQVNRWLLPILWSLVLPMLIFEIGLSFGWSKKRSLVLVWLGFMPFAWQAAGSFTLPVNFGFLLWLAALLLKFKRSENATHGQFYILIGLGVIISFGYTLYALLFWSGLVLFELIRWRLEFTWTQVGFMVIGIALFLPIVEWRFGYSIFSALPVWDGIKGALGSFSGYYLASGPRPHDISAGNIILNQTPSYAFVANAFNQSRWWLVATMFGFWGLFLAGIYFSIVRGFLSLPDQPGNAPINIRRSHYCWLLVFGLGLFIGYIFSRYFLPGEHLLIRRLDPVLALMILLILFAAVSSILSSGVYRLSVVIGVLICVAMITASYSLGPDSRAVGVDEYKAVRYIANEEAGKLKHCVVGDTYVLLALESLTKGEIVGGGFPISHNFEQPELSRLQMNLEDISIKDVRDALRVTGAQNCWLLTKTGGPISYYIKSGNSTSTEFGKITVWNYSN